MGPCQFTSLGPCGLTSLGPCWLTLCPCVPSSVGLYCFLAAVIQALVALVHDPEPEHPLRGDLAEEYVKDRKKFMKNATEFTKSYAERRVA